MDIPYDKVSSKALQGIIEEFVLREGTDYGHQEHDLASKSVQVRRQLELGEAKIVYDPVSGSCSIVKITSAKAP